MRKCSDLARLRPFGYQVLCRPPIEKLATFGLRLHRGFCLLHEGGGLHRVLMSDLAVHTNHVRFSESVFLGLDGLQGAKLYLDTDNDSHASLSASPDSTKDGLDPTEDANLTSDSHKIASAAGGDAVDDAQSNLINRDALTYVLARPSSFGAESTDSDQENS